ncbi:hypothetical protein [Streptomyces anthocyanicus]
MALIKPRRINPVTGSHADENGEIIHGQVSPKDVLLASQKPSVVDE